MKAFVHVRDSVIQVNCATGNQSIGWLANAAVTLYEENHHPLEVTIKMVADQHDKPIDPKAKVRQLLSNGDHVWVVLDDEFGCLEEHSEMKGEMSEEEVNSIQND